MESLRRNSLLRPTWTGRTSVALSEEDGISGLKTSVAWLSLSKFLRKRFLKVFRA
jgi:hypothetical protein